MGQEKTATKNESGYYTSLEACPKIVKTVAKQNNIDLSLFHACEVYQFKSTEEAYYVIIEYGPGESRGFGLSTDSEPALVYNVLAKLYVKNENIPLGDGWDVSLEQIDLYSEESHKCSFPYGDWQVNIKNNEEISWDLVRVNDNYYLKISFDNFVYPPFISEDMYEYQIKFNSSRQCTYNGSLYVRTDVRRTELTHRAVAASHVLNFTDLSIDIAKVPIK